MVQLHLRFSEKEELNALAVQNLAQASHSDPEKVINARGQLFGSGTWKTNKQKKEIKTLRLKNSSLRTERSR